MRLRARRNNTLAVASPTGRQHHSQSGKYRFLWIANSLIIGLIVLWLIVGNSLANRLETPFWQAQATLARQFPVRKANDSAVRLKQLAKDIDIRPLFEAKIQGKGSFLGSSWLTAYLKAEFHKQGNDPTPLPQIYRQYLISQSASIAALRTHLLTHEVPRFAQITDLQAIDFSDSDPIPGPNFLSWGRIHVVLLSDALEKSRLNQPHVALDDLEASWKLNKALQTRPELIAQVFALIFNNWQSGMLRLIDNLPTDWQQRLPDHNYKQSLAVALQLEVDKTFRSIKNYPSTGVSLVGDSLYSLSDQRSVNPIARLLQPIQQPYFTLAAIDFWHNATAVNAEAKKQEILCRWDRKRLKRTWSPAWWNSVGRLADFPSGYLSQWGKVRKAMINWELTKKILQVKELATQTGHFPAVVAGIESSAICPQLHWVYQVSADGMGMSIALQDPPQWLVIRDNDLPVTYSTRLAKAAQ